MQGSSSIATLIAALIVGLVVGAAIGYVAHTPSTSSTTTTTTTSGYGYGYTYTSAAETTSSNTQTGTGAVAQAEYDVQLAYSEEYGLYLVDSEGRTLYFFAKDYNGSSSCYGTCAEHWPIFYVENPKIAPGLSPDDFGVVVRKDGSKQLTYKGWPLYYFAGDMKPGDINGDGIKGVWFVAKPDYTVLVAVKPGLGAYLVDSEGKTLYVFANDVNGTSNCYGQCAMKWPPFTPNSLVVPSTLNLTDFSFTKRSDGTIQLAYKGYPLYYWINDMNRGDTTGHGVKNVWSVAFIGGATFNFNQSTTTTTTTSSGPSY